METLFLTVAFSCCILAATSGELLSRVELLAETQVASFLDSVAQQPLRRGGFETLSPQQNIRLHCAGPAAPHLEQLFFGDGVNVRAKINVSLPLTVAIHGWTERSNMTKYRQLAARFRQFVPDANCCLLDWAPYAIFTYQIAARRSVPLVAERLSRFLQLLAAQLHYTLEDVTLVGFSMGGHIAGLTGKSFGGRIGAIFGLDSAGPLFTLPFDVGPRRRLARTDARYVQVIATCRYALGMGPLLAGAQNFLPNAGYHPQPHCASLSLAGGELLGVRCSHEYALQLFTAALDPAAVILARRCIPVCADLRCLQRSQCQDRVGLYARRIPGNFYL